MSKGGTIIVVAVMLAAGFFSWGAFEESFEKRGWIVAKEDTPTSLASFGEAPDLSVPDRPATPKKVEEPAPEAEQERLPDVLVGLTSGDFPPQVALRETVEFLDITDPSLPPVPRLKESLVIPVRLIGTKLELAPTVGSSLRATVAYQKTDLLERVESMRNGPGESDEAKQAESEKDRFETLGEEKAIELVKREILDERLSELRANQVKGVVYRGQETHRGREAELVEVIFETDTLFGKKQVSAHAVIREGSIERWEWAKTGFEMR